MATLDFVTAADAAFISLCFFRYMLISSCVLLINFDGVAVVVGAEAGSIAIQISTII